MIKEFIPYKIALALKELGFDEPCLAFFEINNTHQPQNLRYFLKTAVNREYIENTKILKYIYGENSLLAPLYQQAFRWFREKYKLEASIQRMPPEVYGKGKGGIKNYLLYIWAENLNPRGQQTLHFDTYEEAELECLKKLIEIVKDGKK